MLNRGWMLTLAGSSMSSVCHFDAICWQFFTRAEVFTVVSGPVETGSAWRIVERQALLGNPFLMGIMIILPPVVLPLTVLSNELKEKDRLSGAPNSETLPVFSSALHSGAEVGILELSSPWWTSLTWLGAVAFGVFSALTFAVSCGNALHSWILTSARNSPFPLCFRMTFWWFHLACPHFSISLSLLLLLSSIKKGLFSDL